MFKHQQIFMYVLVSVIFGGFNLLHAEEKLSPPVEQGEPEAQIEAEVLAPEAPESYEWTLDHMQVGIRWQPFATRPENNAFDAKRKIITEDSSYAQFWISWPSSEPTEEYTDYENKLSPYLKSIETAVDVCIAEGLKVDFVFWHTPAWASATGNEGGWKPKKNEFKAFVKRIATYFKGRVHSYQLYHEANGVYHLYDGDMDFLIDEIFIKGAKVIEDVYDKKPSESVILSTSGCSPCEDCPAMGGLRWRGGKGVDEYYDRLIERKDLMKLVDALNLNVTDQNDGFGTMDGSYISSTWGNYDLVRKKLDNSKFAGKKVIAAESWVSWDASINAVDVNGDGVKNEVDAYQKTLTIMGQCLQRGLNTMNLPWSDNESDWGMGLTKRLDYNGRVKQLQPEIVIPASDGGADVITQKIDMLGDDTNFTLQEAMGEIFTIENYINPADPNHLHYYIWKWYAQIAGGADEVIRHALAGEAENDIKIKGPGFTGIERYRISSYNRTKEAFKVLIYASGASGTTPAVVDIPSSIQEGRYYNNDSSEKDFIGEGFRDGDLYTACIKSKDISKHDGSDVDLEVTEINDLVVSDETLTVTIPRLNKFTSIEFIIQERAEEEKKPMEKALGIIEEKIQAFKDSKKTENDKK